eukprot:scaffold17537_cov180-Skeletonema_marinoi.AAC.3
MESLMRCLQARSHILAVGHSQVEREMLRQVVESTWWMTESMTIGRRLQFAICYEDVNTPIGVGSIPPYLVM